MCAFLVALQDADWVPCRLGKPHPAVAQGVLEAQALVSYLLSQVPCTDRMLSRAVHRDLGEEPGTGTGSSVALVPRPGSP